MSKKILWLDVETTGVDPKLNAIIQLSGCIEINDAIVEEFDFFVRPHADAVIDQQALKVNNITVEELVKFPSHIEIYRTFVSILAKYVNKFDRQDKFILAGYNVGFDDNFLRSFFTLAGDKYYGSFIAFPKIDVVTYVAEDYVNGLRLPNNKLETLCNHYKIPIKAHSAIEDIRATRALYKKLVEVIHG